jgi:hypothetical protein
MARFKDTTTRKQQKSQREAFHLKPLHAKMNSLTDPTERIALQDRWWKVRRLERKAKAIARAGELWHVSFRNTPAEGQEPVIIIA